MTTDDSALAQRGQIDSRNEPYQTHSAQILNVQGRPLSYAVRGESDGSHPPTVFVARLKRNSDVVMDVRMSPLYK